MPPYLMVRCTSATMEPMYLIGAFLSFFLATNSVMAGSEVKPTVPTKTTTMPKKANIFESFSHSAIQQFKEAFGIMDADKDGLLSASDLVAAFGAHGKSIGSGDAQAMLDEVDGPMNFTQMVTLFATKMAGGSDDDDVILASFEAFEQDGKIDAETFRAQPNELH